MNEILVCFVLCSYNMVIAIECEVRNCKGLNLFFIFVFLFN